MYNNIGGKIKFWAIIIFLVLTIASGIINTVYYNQVNNSSWLISIFADITTAYMISLLMYVFGVLFDSIQKIIANILPKSVKSTKQNKVKPPLSNKKEPDDKTEKPKSP